LRVYLDSDVLIWHLRGQPNARTLVARLLASADDVRVLAEQRIEVQFFLKADEISEGLALLDLFETEPVTLELVNRAAPLFWQFQRSHGVDRNDALLAAAALLSEATVYTLNVRHFPMPGVRAIRAW
jgi:predicted nucleic acid-binding protein